MAIEGVEHKFKALIGGIASTLRPYGFAKRGNAFRLLSDDNTAIIHVQRSQWSTGNTIHFTLNAGVVCGRLLDDFETDVSKAGIWDAQLRERIGAFLPKREDKWWTIDMDTQPDVMFAEIESLLRPAVQFVVEHLSDAQLISLWETGASPGLTDGQRQRYLRELKVAR